MTTQPMKEYRCPGCDRLLIVGAFVGWVVAYCPRCPRAERRRTFREDPPKVKTRLPIPA